MLVISRKPGESLRIGDNIRLVIVRLHKDRVRVGIEAPNHVHIAREELEPLKSTGEPAAGK
jgi:carbon storage regulator